MIIRFQLIMIIFLAFFPATAVSETILNIKPTVETQGYLLGENVFFFWIASDNYIHRIAGWWCRVHYLFFPSPEIKEMKLNEY